MKTFLLLVVSFPLLGQMFPFPGPGLPSSGGGSSFSVINGTCVSQGGVSCGSGNGCNSAPAISTTTGHALFCIAAYNINGNATCTPPNNITDTAGDTFTAIGSVNGAGGSFACSQVFYAKNITGNASNVITVQYPTLSQTTPSMACVEIVGANTSTPLDQGPASSAAVAGASPTSASYTTTTANEVLLAGMVDYYSTDTVAANPGYTIPSGATCSSGIAGVGWMAVEYKVVSSIQTGITSGFTVTAIIGYTNIGVATLK